MTSIHDDLADALQCFSNPASTLIRDASYYGPASGADVIAAIAAGLDAVAARLQEISNERLATHEHCA